jgi:3-oxoacyl-[acyl-carrier-protein] synthase II
MRRVVVTGVGLHTGLGATAQETWGGLMEGRSGVVPVNLFDASSLRCRQGGQLLDFTPARYVSKENRRQLRMMTRNDQLAVAGAHAAVADAGLVVAEDEAERAGAFVGSSKELADVSHFKEAFLAARGDDGTVDIHRFGKEAQCSVNPLVFVEGLQAASLFFISQAYGLKGANSYFTGTADAGATAIGRAYRSIRRGESDVVLTGGFDDPINWWAMSNLQSLGLLSFESCRPFDRDRSGTVPGEGAAILVLEERERAMARGARIYAEVRGYGSSFDAFGTLTPAPDGSGVAGAVGAALRDAGVDADRVSYVATHGSGSPTGDVSEVRGLRTALGSAADTVAVSSVKAATGHLMGAAGALNAAVGALAVHHQAVPPTLNLETPDPDCDLDFVPGAGRELAVDHALAVCRGFTGQNVALLFARHDSREHRNV